MLYDQPVNAATHAENEQLFAQLPLGVALFDPHGTLRAVNRAFTVFWDVHPDILINHYNLFQDSHLLSQGLLPDIERSLRGETIQIPGFSFGFVPSDSQAACVHKSTTMMSMPLYDERGALYQLCLIHQEMPTPACPHGLWCDTVSRYRSIIEDQTDLICRFRPNGVITFVNHAYARSVGKNPGALIGQDVFQFVPPDELPAIAFHVASLNAARPEQTYERRLQLPDGSTRWQQWTERAMFDSYGNVVEIQSVGRDITDRVRAEQSLQTITEQLALWVSELEQRNRDITLLSELVNHLHGCQTLTDAYTTFAEVAARLFTEHAGQLHIFEPTHNTTTVVAAWGEIPNDQARLPSPGGLTGAFADTSHSMSLPLMSQNKPLGMLRLWQTQHIAPQAHERWRQLAVTMADQLALVLTTIQLQIHLKYQAAHDSLTGLYNRHHLKDTLTHELRRAARQRQHVGFLMLDIDHFKRINDTYGHDAGDVLLQTVGAFLQQQVRHADTACRFGGEEFALILPDAALASVQARAEQLRHAIKDLRVQHNGRMLHAITVSIGVASFPEHGITDEAIIKAADNALYAAKTAGRDCVVVADLTD